MKSKTVFVCRDCGETSIKWLGRCPQCQSWNTFDEIEVDYLCTCSRERMEKALKSISKEDLRKMFDEQIAEGKAEELEIQCRFCNSKYAFTPDEVL